MAAGLGHVTGRRLLSWIRLRRLRELSHLSRRGEERKTEERRGKKEMRGKLNRGEEKRRGEERRGKKERRGKLNRGEEKQ